MTKQLQLAGLAICVLAAVGCQGGNSERAQKIKDPYPAKVERRDLIGYDMLDKAAIFIPEDAQAVVFPKYKAPVEQVMASVGQTVNRGEVLIQLNFPDAEAAYDAAQQSVREAEAALESARSQFGGPVREAEQVLEQARSIERRVRAETTQGGDATALQQARQQREAAEAAVAEAKRYREDSVRAYQQQLVAAQEAMQQAKQGLRLGSLRAPISGTVTMMNARAGEVVGDDAEEPLAKIVDLGAIKIKAYVPQNNSALIEEGKNVEIAFVEIPNKTFDGKVTKVQALPADDGGSLREVTIDFENDKGVIKEGFKIGWVGVKVGEAKQVLTVPVDAVRNDASGKPTVNVLVNEEWTPRVVETGLSDGRFIEVKSGLEEGETVQVVPDED